MNGYVNIFRSLCNDSIWTAEKFTRGQAWVDMILRANNKEGHIRKRGIRIDLERGQLGYSLKELARIWDWSEGKIRRFVKELEEDGKIKVDRTNVSCTITIVNYHFYQSKDWMIKRTDGLSRDNSTGVQTARRQYPNNNDNSNYNDKKKKYVSGEFKTDTTGFYIAYCDKCGGHQSYEYWNLNQDSRCCSAQLLPTKDLCSNQ